MLDANTRSLDEAPTNPFECDVIVDQESRRRRRRSSNFDSHHINLVHCVSKVEATRLLKEYTAKRGQGRGLNVKSCKIDSIRPSYVLKITETRFWKEAELSYEDEPHSSGTDHERTGNDFATTPASLHTEPVDVTTIKSGESVRVPNSERVVACPGRSENGEECTIDCTQCCGEGKVVRYQVVTAVIAKKSESFYEEREDVHFPNEVLDASTGHSQAEKKRSSGDSGKFFILKRGDYETIPVNEVQCTIAKVGSKKFWIVGLEKNVFAPQVVAARVDRSKCSIM